MERFRQKGGEAFSGSEGILVEKKKKTQGFKGSSRPSLVKLGRAEGGEGLKGGGRGETI